MADGQALLPLQRMRTNLRLHQLKALIGVVEHGGIRAAARQMHLLQAALTKSLRPLEEDAGLALLVRSLPATRGAGCEWR